MSEARKLSMSDFHSRAKANVGKKLFLRTPDGEITESWIRVVNCDSDVMTKAHADFRTLAVENKMKGTPDPDFQRKATEKIVATAVVEWSFEEPCDVDTVCAFLAEAPHIRDEIDTLIYDRKAFFGGAE